MKKLLLPLFSLAFVASASAQVLVIGNDFTGSSNNTIAGTGFIITNASAFDLAHAVNTDQSSFDGTWGSASLTPPPNSTTAGRVRASGTGNGVYSFTITNSGTQAAVLSGWHIDSWGSVAGITNSLQLNYIGTPGGAFGEANIAGTAVSTSPGNRVMTNYDNTTFSYGDNTLGVGESASFQLVIGNESGLASGFVAYDNFAVSAIPEPGTFAFLAGSSILLLFRRRR